MKSAGSLLISPDIYCFCLCAFEISEELFFFFKEIIINKDKYDKGERAFQIEYMKANL